MNQKEAITIFTADVARHLIRNGYILLDIKPNKENKDRTLFIFKLEPEIRKVIWDYKQSRLAE